MTERINKFVCGKTADTLRYEDGVLFFEGIPESRAYVRTQVFSDVPPEKDEDIDIEALRKLLRPYLEGARRHWDEIEQVYDRNASAGEVDTIGGDYYVRINQNRIIKLFGIDPTDPVAANSEALGVIYGSTKFTMANPCGTGTYLNILQMCESDPITNTIVLCCPYVNRIFNVLLAEESR